MFCGFIVLKYFCKVFHKYDDADNCCYINAMLRSHIYRERDQRE